VGGKSVEKWSFGRWRRRWEDDIKLDLGDVGFEDWSWEELSQDYVQ
jgi:hypothetical protein